MPHKLHMLPILHVLHIQYGTRAGVYEKTFRLRQFLVKNSWSLLKETPGLQTRPSLAGPGLAKPERRCGGPGPAQPGLWSLLKKLTGVYYKKL